MADSVIFLKKGGENPAAKGKKKALFVGKGFPNKKIGNSFQIPPLAFLAVTLYNGGQVVDCGAKNHAGAAKW